MNELYEMIEKKIKESGYPRPISGSDVYDDICDQCLKITHSACHGTGIQKNIPDGENAVQSPCADHKVRSEIGKERKKKEIRTLAEISFLSHFNIVIMSRNC